MSELSFEETYRKYRIRIERYFQYQYGYNLQDAEDLTRDTFLLLWLKWDCFDNYEELCLVGWLYETAKYKSLEQCRSNTSRPITYSYDEYMSDDPYAVEFSDLLSMDEKIPKDRYLKYIEKIKSHLNPKEREIFEYIVEKQYSVPQIAEILHENPTTVKVRWFRVRKKIKLMLPKILGKM